VESSFVRKEEIKQIANLFFRRGYFCAKDLILSEQPEFSKEYLCAQLWRDYGWKIDR